MSRLISFSDSASSSPPPAHPPAAASGLQAGKTARPLKRAAPRFLGDDDSDDGGMAARLAKKRTNPEDIEKLFAELDGDSEDGDIRLPPPLKNRNNATQDSIIDDTITAFGRNKKKKGKAGENGEGDLLDDKIDGQEGEKKRKAPRKRVMMNEERLMGDRGFRKLRENLTGFKIKGKGHEEEDLRRLMTVYQLWAHQMFPAGNFKDTIQTVEKLCHKKGVKYELTVWRDEAKGIFRPKAGECSDADGDMEGAEGANENDDEHRPPTTSQPASPDPNRPKKSYFDNIPTSSPSGGLVGGDAEMGEDGMLDSDDEMDPRRQARGRSSLVPSDLGEDLFGKRAGTSEAGFNDADLGLDLDNEAEEEDFDMDAEAEAAMREMEMMGEDELPAAKKAIARAPSAGPSKVHKPINFYANAVADPKKVAQAAASEKGKGKSVSQAPPAEDNFDDFDLGDEEDIMREMEMEEQRQSASRPASVAADLSKTPSLSTGTDDFDFDDLEEDEDFLKEMSEVEQQQPTVASTVVQSPAKAKEAVFPEPVMEEEEDLYS